MDFEYNRDEKRRNGMLHLKEGWGTDLIRFHSLNNVTLKTLLDEKFADPDERQNESPTIQEFYDFIEQYPEFTAHGYITSLERDDYRLTIEGVEGWCENGQAFSDFITTFRFADEFDIDEYKLLYCWYD